MEALNRDEHIIRAVSFDLWETLLFENDGASTRRARARWKNLTEELNSLGVRVSLEDVSAAISEVISLLVTVWESNRDVSCVDQIRLIIKRASRNSLDLKPEWIKRLVSAYNSSILEVPPYLNPEARKVMVGLKERHKQIGLICNTGLTSGNGLREFLANERVPEYFDSMIFSEEIGIRKPDPRIFRLAAEDLDVQPCEIVHVGDNLKTDVWGAKNAGLKAIYFSSQQGRDRIAESDPKSLVSLSRKLNSLNGRKVVPDITISSLSMLMKAIEELERQS